MSKITLSDAIAKKTIIDECDGTEKVVLSYTTADGNNGMASVPVSYFNTGSSGGDNIGAYWSSGNFVITKNDKILSSIQPVNDYHNGLMSYQDKIKLDSININNIYNYWMYYYVMHTYALEVFVDNNLINIINTYKSYGISTDVDVTYNFNVQRTGGSCFYAFDTSNSKNMYMIATYKCNTIIPYYYFNGNIDPLTDAYFCKAVSTKDNNEFYFYIYDLKSFMHLNNDTVTPEPIVSLESNNYAFVTDDTVKFCFR